MNIGGFYIGSELEVENLHSTGNLRTLLVNSNNLKQSKLSRLKQAEPKDFADWMMKKCGACVVTRTD